MLIGDVIGSGIHLFLSGFGLIANSLLMYVVVKCSPKNVQTYSIMLLNFAVTDWSSCFLEFLLLIRPIPYIDNILYIPHGIAALFGPKVCWVLYNLLLCFYAHLNYSLLASFLFRLYVLYFQNPSRITLFAFLILLSTPAVFQGILALPFAISQWDIDFIPLMSQIYPEFANKDTTIFGSMHIGNDWRGTLATMLIFLPLIPVTITALIVRSWILWKLRKLSMSESMKKLHRSLLQALTLQMLLPIFYIIGTAFYIIMQFYAINGPFYEYGLFVTIGAIPALSPLLPLYFVTAYRNWIRVHIFRKKSALFVVSSTGKMSRNDNVTTQTQKSEVGRHQMALAM